MEKPTLHSHIQSLGLYDQKKNLLRIIALDTLMYINKINTWVWITYGTESMLIQLWFIIHILSFTGK